MAEFEKLQRGTDVTGKSSDNAVQAKFQANQVLQKAKANPASLSPKDVAQLQKIIGNKAVCQLMDQQTIQRVSGPEEEEELPIQGKFEVVQRADMPEEEEEPLQMKAENQTGMPDNLKAGVENLSGMDMSDVRVHYNSDKPSEVGALAYTQGTDIHVAPGQEQHLAHEAWHVVQQAEGRVQPTTQLKDVAVNDDVGLESEADVMGSKALNG